MDKVSDELLNMERSAATASDISFRSLMETKTELKQEGTMDQYLSGDQKQDSHLQEM